MKPCFCFFIFLFLLAGTVNAQTPHVQKYYLTKRNEPILVNKMLQSREGYIWFATNKGLFRFDGQQYKSFGMADSLPDLNVTALAQDSLGRIWTAHGTGKITYFSENRFHTFDPPEGLSPSPVSDILFDDDGVLWFATLNDGLYYFKNDRLHRLDEQEGMPDLYVYDIEPGPNGSVLAGTDGGMAICSFKNDKLSIDVINHTDGLKDNIIRKIYRIDDNTMLLGTEDEGVLRYDLSSKSFASLTTDLQLSSVSDIVVKLDRAWITSSRNGVTVVDLKSGVRKHYGEAGGSPLPIMLCLLVDSESSIWSGSRAGIFRTLGDELEFISVPVADRDPNVMAVTIEKNGALWFSTQDGLFKRKQVSIGKYETVNVLAGTGFSHLRVISLHRDNDGFIWAGLYGEGVLRIDPVTNRIRLISKELRNGNVLSISAGDGNTVWLATLGGAEKIVIEKNALAITHYSSENGLSSDFVYQVYVDSEKRVWFATDGKGVDLLDSKGVHHLENGLASKVVYGFAEDAAGRIWVNTQDAGIHFFDGEKFVEAKTEANGFRDLNNFILTSDRAGRIVAMHNSGIDIYDPGTKAFRYLDEHAGLENRVANLNSASRDLNDNLIFGTSSGIVFLGYTSAVNPFPKIHIEGVSLVGKKSFLSLKEPLTYNENNLIMRFRGFWFQNPEDVSFEYKMDNYDADWIVTRDNAITYSQLPPGDYSFRVRPTNVAVGTESIVKFTIEPPFWRTAGFLALVIVVAAALAFSYIRYRERALKEAKIELEKKVEERTLEIQRNSEEIQAQNEEIMAQAEEIKGINENLEMIVNQRTAELERKNRALEEYAFINAHKLRSPVASILGLVNLLNKSDLNDDCKVINRHLLNSADELDNIVRSITKAIEKGEQ
jgi:ligand-binding sensor domain-containing protein